MFWWWWQCDASNGSGDCALQAGVALTLCQQLATSMGPGIKQYVRVLGSGIVSNFGDSKVSVNCCVYMYSLVRESCRWASVSWHCCDCCVVSEDSISWPPAPVALQPPVALRTTTSTVGHHEHCRPPWALWATRSTAGHQEHCGPPWALWATSSTVGHHEHCGPPVALWATMSTAGHQEHCGPPWALQATSNTAGHQ